MRLLQLHTGRIQHLLFEETERKQNTEMYYIELGPDKVSQSKSYLARHKGRTKSISVSVNWKVIYFMFS